MTRYILNHQVFRQSCPDKRPQGRDMPRHSSGVILLDTFEELRALGVEQ